jgi:predicted glycoside hydrolase/deacetylase ChbG (UPF0249 family)
MRAAKIMKRLIVNADDFGMTQGVNRGILEAHRSGIVSSTTLLANGAAFAEAAAAGRETPDLGIGVHLNLSEGLPVSPAAGIPSLLDAQGRLHWTPERLWSAIATRRVRLAEIEVELRAQVDKIVEAGIVPTHLDGHMHVHVLPGVSEMVVKVARESRIPAVRCPMEPVSRLLRRLPADPQARVSATNRRFVSLAVSWAARRLRRLLEKAGLVYPARFYGIVETGFLDLHAIEEILCSLPDDAGTIGPGTSGTGTSDPDISELMCHPGYVDGNLAQVGGRLQTQRESELQALTSPEATRLATARGVQLTTYRELAELKASRGAAV